MANFQLNQELMRLQENDVRYDSNVPDVGTMDPRDVHHFFEELCDVLQSDPQRAIATDVFDKLKMMIASFESLEVGIAHHFIDLMVTAFNDQMVTIGADLHENAQHNFEVDHVLVMKYAFLVTWLVESAEARWVVVKQQMDKENAAAAYASGKTKSKKATSTSAKKKKNATNWNWKTQRLSVLQGLVKLVKLDLRRLIVSSSERETVVGLVGKSTSLMIEDTETIKSEDGKEAAMTIVCDVIHKYETFTPSGTTGVVEKRPTNSLTGMQGRILHDYLREEHLSDFCSEVLISLTNDYENPQPVDNVLRFSSEKSFAEKEVKQSKAFAKFLVKLSEQLPHETLKQMVNLQSHIDSQSYNLRIAMMEVIGNIIHNYLATDTSDNAAAKLYSLYDILEERFRDNSSYVRNKVLQILSKLAEFRPNSNVTDIPVARRLQLVRLAIGRLRDKTSTVRRSALKLLITFIKCSPFTAIANDEGRLSLSYFKDHKESLEKIIRAKTKGDGNGEESVQEASVEVEGDGTEVQDDTEMEGVEGAVKTAAVLDEDSPFNAPSNEGNDTNNSIVVEGNQNEEDDIATEEQLSNLRNLLLYYEDGIRFIDEIEGSINYILELLGSNVKSEVIETMNFFVTAHEYGMDCAMGGLLKMSHKVWDKDTGENERLSVRDHVLLCYGTVFFSSELTSEETELHASEIANNLIQVIMTMSMAEQTSFEQIVGLIVKQGKFPGPVIDSLWSIFVAKREYTVKRRGAIKILGMIAKIEKSVVAMGLDSLLKVGLGNLGRKDLILAKYTCVALQQLGSVSREKGMINQKPPKRLQATHPIFRRILSLMLEPTNSPTWFEFAEQGINSIYSVSEHPDELAEAFLKKMFETTFLEEDVYDDFSNIKGDDEDEDGEEEVDRKPTKQITFKALKYCDSIQLSKLCFVVGHIAIKQIVHLESIELEWKRRKFMEEDRKRKFEEDKENGKLQRSKGKSKANKSRVDEEEEEDELDNVIGTAEDEIVDWIQNLRERELLYGENSILAKLAPVVVYICTNNTTFSNPTLQAMAVLSLCKLMCVSSDFCEQHLQLLFTILERTSSPIIRSNIIIGLGDMTICFNSLIDQNISYLYRRLSDPDMDVKKNTFMVLTFLILNGMVKVKGHLSEMAKCLVDDDRRISDLAKLFFNELASKDNAIYNNLPDIISNLSHSTNGVDEDKFKEIMNFLLVLIKKDRQTESLVDKLCQRFKTSDNERQWRDIGLCLASLQYNSDKAIRRVLEHYVLYQHKLYEPTLRKYMNDVVQKAKKGAKSTEVKQSLDEFELRLSEEIEVAQ